MVWIQIRPDILLVLILVHTVRKGYKQMTKVTTSMERVQLTLKAPITTAADDKFWFSTKNKVWYYMRIVCQQTILMKYHALFVIFEKAENS